ncbi:MAG: hypothetical protein IJO29_00250 [Oscillospiraceae bacterium]|nr:hypothetical protein [Oscillospiraceae bacterium]
MITCVFGLPGSGKSTLMAKKCCDAMRKRLGRAPYDKVYCNFYLKGAYPIRFDDLGVYNFENCLILIDEAMNEADSRDFKSFDALKKYYFSNHRHYGVDICYFTQAWDDVDKKIRNNTEELYIVRKFLWWSYTRSIQRIIDINSDTHEIITGYGWVPFSYKFYFRPRYYKYFNSFERKKLDPLLERHKIPY